MKGYNYREILLEKPYDDNNNILLFVVLGRFGGSVGRGMDFEISVNRYIPTSGI